MSRDRVGQPWSSNVHSRTSLKRFPPKHPDNILLPKCSSTSPPE
uniref:Uncharacterized protein n=1 Tax=Anguilla anguilla TaxID=7936 RepID=A0A0E9W2V7_ANGAN